MLFSMAGMQMDMVARSWLAYDISGSGLALGLVAAARGVPQLLCSAFAGVAADRLDKRRLLIISQASLALLAAINGVLVHLGIVEVWHLVVLGALQGTVFAFNMPARQAFIPELVGRERLANALAIHATGMNANRVLAPVIAGLLIAWHPVAAFYAIAVLFGTAALMLMRLPRGRAPTVPGRGALTEILGGYLYVARQPVLRVLLAMAFVPLLFGMPYQQVLPVFQADVLRVGPSELGFMYTMIGIGSLVGTLLITALANDPRKTLIQTIAGTAFGVSLLLFALSRSYELSLVLLLIVGLSSQGYMTINSTLIMLNTDRKFYGRVMSVYMASWAVVPLATLPVGALVDLIGAPATMAASGAILAAFMALMAFVLPARAAGARDAAPHDSTTSSGSPPPR